MEFPGASRESLREGLAGWWQSVASTRQRYHPARKSAANTSVLMFVTGCGQLTPMFYSKPPP